VKRIPPGFSTEYIAEQRERLFKSTRALTPPLANLMHKINKCVKCPRLVKSRSLYSVNGPTFGFGNARSCMVLIGQSPGWRGCGTTGFPFEPKSRTGKIFEECLKASGLTFEDVWTTNLVKCCPEGSLTPSNREIENCSPFLVSEIRHINPVAVISIGRLAHNFTVKNRLYRDFKCYKIYHPGYILRKGNELGEYISQFASIISEIMSNVRKNRDLNEWM